MRNNILFLSLAISTGIAAQTTHELHMSGEAFMPDTLYMLPGDSVHLVFDTLGHSMVQVPQESWEQEIPSPSIGFSMGYGTINPGDFHTFAIDSIGTFYYLCEQHPDEKGVIMVGDEFTSIKETSLPDLEMYPQPASDRLFISNAMDHATIQLSDDRGRPLRKFEGIRSNGIEVSDLTPGIYFVTLLDERAVPVARGKVIVSR